jgi:hypothetical protein
MFSLLHQQTQKDIFEQAAAANSGSNDTRFFLIWIIELVQWFLLRLGLTNLSVATKTTALLPHTLCENGSRQ